MIVVCINNEPTGKRKYHHYDFSDELTINKQYEVFHFVDNSYCILNDLGRMEFYPFYRFVTLEEFRERQLNKLGI
jgi:hypothetical protein